MRSTRRARWALLAALCLGSVAQLSTCREESALFGLRTAFTSFTLPFNVLLRQILLGV